MLTYNWGAIDAVIAGTIKRRCPVLHAEDGFGPEESVRLKRRRTWTRRIFLNRIDGTIVPSRQLERIVTTAFGVDLQPECSTSRTASTMRRFSPGRDSTSARRTVYRTTPCWSDPSARSGPKRITASSSRPSRKIPRENVWVAFAPSAVPWHDLAHLARERGLEARTVFAGPLADTAPFYRTLDAFALSSSTVTDAAARSLEAMASGLPVVATDVGDIREMLAPADQDRAILYPVKRTGLRVRARWTVTEQCITRATCRAESCTMCETVHAGPDVSGVSGRVSKSASTCDSGAIGLDDLDKTAIGSTDSNRRPHGEAHGRRVKSAHFGKT